jgi:hypothetical protein
MSEDREGQLPQVEAAAALAGRLPGRLHRGQQHAHERGHDRDHDEQFDEAEPASPSALPRPHAHFWLLKLYFLIRQNLLS